MRTIIVITDTETGLDRYHYEDKYKPVKLTDSQYIKKYACLSDAIKDSEPYTNDHYSDGECLDYVLNVIKQLEEN